MTRAVWYFDFISPFAYLQHEMLGRVRAAGAEIAPVPVLFAGLLQHWENKGPAEIAPKRLATNRFCQWYADANGIAFRMPPAHPFNPLGVLRLSIALDNDAAAVAAIFGYIWAEGGDIETAEGWAELTGRLGIADAEARIAAPAVKDALRANTEAAVAAGVFGVPTLLIGGEPIWGMDATDMAVAYLDNPELFTRGEMKRIAELPFGATRRKV